MASHPHIRSVDILIIGGGIVGASVCRDAALHGFEVLLTEQGDFASGTSSRSSRLLHGGLRYLAQGHVGLVREASREKMILSRIAPHLCDPLPFVFPVYRQGNWPFWKLRIGVRIYDWLCGRHGLGHSSTLSVDQTQSAVPGLSVDNLTGATRHFDAFTNDARLVIDTLLSAQLSGAEVRNYQRFVEATRQDDVWHCVLEDTASGTRSEIQA
ncbi:MAG: FAD-dependent oxidoreductase, partial [Planctomycetaceae bacterium]|nr:FAD-dependent oxidoreductase [Planctomycetaceae bacterium]